MMKIGAALAVLVIHRHQNSGQPLLNLENGHKYTLGLSFDRGGSTKKIFAT